MALIGTLRKTLAANRTNPKRQRGNAVFSSPEQLRGDEIDVRSDIYAVGVTLFYLLFVNPTTNA
jgi:serine/threonine protein kinase